MHACFFFFFFVVYYDTVHVSHSEDQSPMFMDYWCESTVQDTTKMFAAVGIVFVFIVCLFYRQQKSTWIIRLLNFIILHRRETF